MPGGGPTTWSELKDFLRVEDELNDGWQERATVRVFRIGQWVTAQPGPQWAPARKLWWLVYRVWVQTLVGSDLAPQLACGRGVRFAHGGRNIVIHHRATIGERATIYHGVTIGMRGVWEVPTIGDDVTLGAGCTILGGITIGDGAAIGPNAVIVRDVGPRQHVVAGAGTTLAGELPLGETRRTGLGRVVPRLRA